MAQAVLYGLIMLNEMAGAEGIRENGHAAGAGAAMELKLRVTDAEILAELERRPQESERQLYALGALRVGVLALRQASGVIDVESVRAEGERLLAGLRAALSEQANGLTNGVSAVIAQYFDPRTGNLTQRLERLVCKDGELERVLAHYVDGETSSLGRTLTEFVGEESEILKQLSPKQADGFLSATRAAVTETLNAEREHLVRQFSLDDRESALSRLVAEITDENGRLRNELAQDMERVRREFSLDNGDGALSRLVKQVQEAAGEVKRNLTLDVDASPMARLRRELLDVLNTVKQANADFQSEVRSKLAEITARRDESDRSTLHGLDFEDAVGVFLRGELEGSGDILEETGCKGGKIQRCKLGDFVLTLGAESAAADCRIVFEAKDNKSYNLKAALDELAEARDNRAAQVGVFVFSKAAAPQSVRTLARFGNDIVAIWDREQGSSDPVLSAALSLARALVVREQSASELTEADFGAIEDAVRHITRAADTLGDIMTMAGTVRSNGEKIRNQAEKMQSEIVKQLAVLKEHVGALKNHAAS